MVGVAAGVEGLEEVAVEVVHRDGARVAVGDVDALVEGVQGDAEGAGGHGLSVSVGQALGGGPGVDQGPVGLDDGEGAGSLVGEVEAVGARVDGDAGAGVEGDGQGQLVGRTRGDVDDGNLGGRHRGGVQPSGGLVEGEGHDREVVAAGSDGVGRDLLVGGVEDGDLVAARRADVDTVAGGVDDDVAGVADDALVELLDEVEGGGVVDGDGVLAGVGHPHGAVLVVDLHAVDGVAEALDRVAAAVGGGRVHGRQHVVDDLKGVGVELDEGGVAHRGTPHGGGDVDGVVPGGVGALVQASQDLGLDAGDRAGLVGDAGHLGGAGGEGDGVVRARVDGAALGVGVGGRGAGARGGLRSRRGAGGGRVGGHGEGHELAHHRRGAEEAEPVCALGQVEGGQGDLDAEGAVCSDVDSGDDVGAGAVTVGAVVELDRQPVAGGEAGAGDGDGAGGGVARGVDAHGALAGARTRRGTGCGSDGDGLRGEDGGGGRDGEAGGQGEGEG